MERISIECHRKRNLFAGDVLGSCRKIALSTSYSSTCSSWGSGCSWLFTLNVQRYIEDQFRVFEQMNDRRRFSRHQVGFMKCLCMNG